MIDLEIRKRIWVARHSNQYHDIVELFNSKPIRSDGVWETFSGSMELDPFWFNDLMWEDEPREVILVKNEEKIAKDHCVWIARDDVNGENLFIYKEFPHYNFNNSCFENRYDTSFMCIDEQLYPEIKPEFPPQQYLIQYKK